MQRRWPSCGPQVWCADGGPPVRLVDVRNASIIVCRFGSIRQDMAMDGGSRSPMSQPETLRAAAGLHTTMSQQGEQQWR